MRNRTRAWLRYVTIAVALCIAAPALALDPARRVDQYRHTRWTSESGAPTEVRVITQTPDGFLWLGGDDGLYRFDGMSFERVPLPNPRHGHGSGVNALTVTRTGALIVGFDLGGVGVYHRGRFTYLADQRVRATVRSLAEDRQGGIWVALASTKHQLGLYRDGVWRIIDATSGLPPGLLTTLHVGRDGVLWFGMDNWLGYLPPGEHRIRTVDTSVGIGPGLAEDRDGRLWISDTLGARRFSDPRGGRIEPGARFRVGASSAWTHLFVDGDQNLWGGGFGGGLFRVRALAAPSDANSDSKPIETYPAKAGLTGDVAWSVFEDREGNIWVGTNGGLDRFGHANIVRQPAVTTDSPYGYGLWSSRGAVLVGDRNKLLKAEPGRPLKTSFDDIAVSAVCEGANPALWIFAGQGGEKLERMYRIAGGRRTEVRLPWPVSRPNCAVDEGGDLWVTARDAPAYRWDGHDWRAYAAEGVPDFSSVVATSKGRAVLIRNRQLFQADASGLKTLDYGAERFFPGNLVQVWRDPDRTFVVASNGLVRLDADQPRFLSDTRFAWMEDINGMARQVGGSTWIRAKDGVAQIRSMDLDRALVDPRFTPTVRIFSLLDGLIGSGTGALSRPVVIGGDGRVWLATTSGVFTIDPNHLYRNKVPPPVVITALTADGRTIKDPENVELSKGAKSLQIDYTALSLTAPERVSFRYRLSGVDRDWVDPGKRRQAFYTNLKPGRYVFQVKAANDDGLWNHRGARLAFRLPPTFVQSKLFLILCLLAGIGLGWLIYSLRLRQVSERIRGRLQERLAERERIARELHDTLLQGVQGLVLKFHAATRKVPDESLARQQLESALHQAEDVMVEARERVRDLRSATGENLAESLAKLPRRVDPDRTMDIRISAKGANRPLHPIVADEIEKIVGEALVNAVRHAKGRTIIVEITYGPSQLGVKVSDDGVGLDQSVMEAGGREGRYGLTGMRERAAKIGGDIAIRNSIAAGVEVELLVPAAAAYSAARRRESADFFARRD